MQAHPAAPAGFVILAVIGASGTPATSKMGNDRDRRDGFVRRKKAQLVPFWVEEHSPKGGKWSNAKGAGPLPLNLDTGRRDCVATKNEEKRLCIGLNAGLGGCVQRVLPGSFFVLF